MRTIKVADKTFEVLPEPGDYWNWVEKGNYNHEFGAYDKYLKPEHTFVDLGAWVGGHTLYAGTIAKQVIAVEPDPVAFDILRGNARNATLVHKAVADAPGTVTLGSGLLGASTTRRNPNEGAGIGKWVEGQTFEVECVTLRELVKDLPDPLFIKIDVEGSEEYIFQDLNFFRERKPRVLIELHPFWWRTETRTWREFDALQAIYPNATSIFGNTWVLCE